MTQAPRTWPLGLRIVVPLALILAAVGLILGVQNAFQQQEQQRVTNTRNIQSNLAACARGNLLRQQTKDGFAAVDDSVNGVLNLFLTPRTDAQEPQIEAFRAKLAEPLARLHQAQDKIPIVDCMTVTAGASQLTPAERDAALHPPAG